MSIVQPWESKDAFNRYVSRCVAEAYPGNSPLWYASELRKFDIDRATGASFINSAIAANKNEILSFLINKYAIPVSFMSHCVEAVQAGNIYALDLLLEHARDSIYVRKLRLLAVARKTGFRDMIDKIQSWPTVSYQMS